MNNAYLTDIIGDTYKTWKKGDSIILSSGTGTGKTTFCKTLILDVLQIQEKILYLVSRTAKQKELITEMKQLEIELKSQDININIFKHIIIITYQKLEAAISHSSKSLYEYAACKYIFCDECHYFTDDIAIPDSTPSISESWIRSQSHSIKIYASATANDFFTALIKKKNIPDAHIYTIPKNFDYISNIYFFKKIQLTQLIDRILRTESESKILIYINSSRQMSDLYDIYGTDFADYLCSRNTKDKLLQKICNLRSGTNININKRILFTTKTLDVGINIIDPLLKHIICEIPEINTMIQCFGRKRPINQYDTCTFYIEDKTIHNFIPQHNMIQKHINRYNDWKKDPLLFQNKHSQDRNLTKDGSIFYLNPGSSEIKIDYTRLYNYKKFLSFYEEIKLKGYQQTIYNNIGTELQNKISQLPESKDERAIFIEYLKSLEDKYLYKIDQKELQIKINDLMRKLNQSSKTLGMKIINRFLDKNFNDLYTKRFVSEKDYRRSINNKQNPHYKQMYWILQ